MAEVLKPNMSSLWASGGAKIAPTSEKVQTGWTAEIPPHQWENWVQNRQDEAIAYMFQHGIPEWDAGTEYFSNRSYVQRNGILYRSLTNSTGRDPLTNSADWVTVTAVATTTQAQSFTDDVGLLTSRRLFESFQGPNQNLFDSGFQRLPGGLLVQWVRNRTVFADSAGNATIVVPFPIPFTTSVFGSSFTPVDEFSSQAGRTIVSQGPSLTQVLVNVGNANPNVEVAVSGIIIGV